MEKQFVFSLLCWALVVFICEAKYPPDEAIQLCKNSAKKCFKKFNKTLDENDPNRIIKSDGFGRLNYQDNLRCCWLLESPEPTAKITINFHYFELEEQKRCVSNDYVKIFKQRNNAQHWDTIIWEAGLCGKQEEFSIEETTKRILIFFHSDRSIGATGFNATFSIVVTDLKPRILYLGDVNKMEQTLTSSGPAIPQNVSFEERDELTVQCRVEATPPPEKYTWVYATTYNSSIPMEEGHPFVKAIFANGMIRLHNMKIADSGNLSCTAANRNANTTGTVPITIKEKCICPKRIATSWYDNPPYIYEKNGKMKGIFYNILTNMVDEVCGNCTGGHGTTEILWNINTNKPSNGKRGLSDVKGEIEDGTIDMYFPISGGKNDEQYRNMFYFLPMVDSPGVAFLIVGEETGASAQVIFDSILQGWPILVLLVVMSALSGIIMWMLDTYWNEEQFPRNISDGVIEGFWWAFVTMTTVGYGDIAPKGVPGRLFAVVWILTGLVIIAIFTGVITTSLTVVALESNVKLYGTTVAAINNTAEFRMGVVKNAKMQNYSNFDKLAAAMNDRKVKGCLVDSYVAAYYKGLFSSNRVNNIFPSTKSYGVVLGQSLSKQFLYDKLSEYLEKNKVSVTKAIEDNTDTLEAESSSAASEKASGLFDPESSLFKSSLHGCLILLVILSFGGLVFEYAYLRPRHRMIQAAKNLEMVESIEVKEMALRARLLKQALLYEVGQFYERWSEKLTYLKTQHKQEQRQIISKGSTPGPAASGKWNKRPLDDMIMHLNDDEAPGTSSNTTSAQGSLKSLIKDEKPGPSSQPGSIQGSVKSLKKGEMAEEVTEA